MSINIGSIHGLAPFGSIIAEMNMAQAHDRKEKIDKYIADNRLSLSQIKSLLIIMDDELKELGIRIDLTSY